MLNIVTDCQVLLRWAIARRADWHTQQFWAAFGKTADNLSARYNNEHVALIAETVELIRKFSTAERAEE